MLKSQKLESWALPNSDLATPCQMIGGKTALTLEDPLPIIIMFTSVFFICLILNDMGSHDINGNEPSNVCTSLVSFFVLFKPSMTTVATVNLVISAIWSQCHLVDNHPCVGADLHGDIQAVCPEV